RTPQDARDSRTSVVTASTASSTSHVHSRSRTPVAPARLAAIAIEGSRSAGGVRTRTPSRIRRSSGGGNGIIVPDRQEDNYGRSEIGPNGRSRQPCKIHIPCQTRSMDKGERFQSIRG